MPHNKKIVYCMLIMLKNNAVYDNHIFSLCFMTLSHFREIIYYCVAIDFVLYFGPSRINFWTKVIRNRTQYTNVDKIWVSKNQ